MPTIHTICIASRIELQCENCCFDTTDDTDAMDTSDCCSFGYDKDLRAKTTIHANDTKIARSTDYAVNVMYVLGFLSSGDGGTEAGRLLAMLGLPNGTTMATYSFPNIENRIGQAIRDLGKEIVRENLIAEVRKGMVDWNEATFNKWKSSLTDDSVDLNKEEHAVIQASHDHAWQQKGAGHTYDSLSGHGCFFGRNNRKCIALSISSKKCNYCNAFKKKHPDSEIPQEHLPYCWKNHEGSSGSMEPAACLKLLTELYDDSKVITKTLCCDDDSSIRADCQWNNATFELVYGRKPDKVRITKGKNIGKMQDRPDKGKLPARVPEPKFVSDPNHRRKGLTGECIKLDLKTKSTNLTMTRNDSVRIGKNFACVARQIHKMEESEWDDAGRAVLEHHFGNHQYCGAWCLRKQQNESKEDLVKKKLFYRDKEEVIDKKLYEHLKPIIEKYVAHNKLADLNHDMDTNINEAFNAVCTHFAPMNKIFCGSGSLHNRISFAVGIHSVGWTVFMERLLDELGIAMSPELRNYLQKRDNQRNKKIAMYKTKDYKLKRGKKKMDKKKESANIAQKERMRRQGTYKRGMAIDDLWTIPENEAPVCQPVAKKRKGKQKQYCPFCGKTTHATTRSKKCEQHGNAHAEKLYRKEDGVLLSTLLADNSDGVPAVAALPAPVPTQEPESTALTVEDEANDMEDADALPLFDEDSDEEEEQQKKELPDESLPLNADDSEDEDCEGSGDDETIAQQSVSGILHRFRDEPNDSDDDSLGIDIVESWSF